MGDYNHANEHNNHLYLRKKNLHNYAEDTEDFTLRSLQIYWIFKKQNNVDFILM